MSNRVIVMVYDQDDAKHGEISVMENPQKAARLVETLLEAGFSQDRIRIFTGDEMGMQVNHRPVVSLVDARAAGTAANEEAAEPPPAPERAPQQDVAAASPRAAGAPVAEMSMAAPFTREGVRFSTLFRPA